MLQHGVLHIYVCANYSTRGYCTFLEGVLSSLTENVSCRATWVPHDIFAISRSMGPVRLSSMLAFLHVQEDQRACKHQQPAVLHSSKPLSKILENGTYLRRVHTDKLQALNYALSTMLLVHSIPLAYHRTSILANREGICKFCLPRSFLGTPNQS